MFTGLERTACQGSSRNVPCSPWDRPQDFAVRAIFSGQPAANAFDLGQRGGAAAIQGEADSLCHTQHTQLAPAPHPRLLPPAHYPAKRAGVLPVLFILQ